MSAAPPWSDAHRALVSIDQLTAADVDALVAQSARIAGGAWPAPRRFLLGQLMLQPTLRTRLGFAAAAHRLGGAAIDIDTRPITPDASGGETLAHTLRVASGMVDVLASRLPDAAGDLTGAIVCPFISGGDALEHPVQGLVDAFAIEHFAKPIAHAAVGVVGDMSMRSVRSLLKVFRLRPPRELRLIAPDSRRGDAAAIAAPLKPVFADPVRGYEGLDAVIFAGLPARRGADVLEAPARRAFALTPDTLPRLTPHAVVLSPGPVIDEVDDAVMGDARVRIFAQSDISIAMRAAMLGRALDLA